MLQGTGNLYTNTDIDISPWSDYANGSCLFGFDFSPEMQSGNTGHLDLLKEGNLDLEVKLGKPSSFSITMIVMLEFDHLIEMNDAGDVVTEP